MMSVLTVSAMRWMERRRQRVRLRRLLDHDDRTLEDIGLRRSEIEHALALPWNADPAAEARRLSRRALCLDRKI